MDQTTAQAVPAQAQADAPQTPEVIGSVEKSASIKNLAAALARFQSAVQSIAKDGSNPFFKSKYATLENIVSTVRPILADNGLAFTQLPCGKNELTTMLLHSSGEYIASTVAMAPKENTPQGQGSAISYMRRYALSAILGIVTDEDDDGNEASKPQRAPAAAKPNPVPAKAPAPQRNIKADILAKVKALRPGETIGKDNIGTIVFELATLDLVEANYEEINNRLQVLMDERKAA